MEWIATSIAAAADGPAARLSDDDLVARILGGEDELFEIVMRRHNRQLYRAARAIVRDEAEVEDVLQQAYLNAFAHLAQFEARSRLSTWLTRIVINEASARRRRSLRTPSSSGSVQGAGGTPQAVDIVPSALPSPERQAYAGELQRALADAVDLLPEPYRLVFVLRDVEGLSTSETGLALDLGDEAVKTRLHRARAILRRAVAARLGALTSSLFEFPAPRCDRVVHAVLGQLTRTDAPPSR